MDVNDIMKIIKHNIEKSKNDFEKAKRGNWCDRINQSELYGIYIGQLQIYDILNDMIEEANI